MKKNKTEKTPGEPKTTKASTTAKHTYFKQADFPQTDLQQAQKIASALVDNFAGKEGSPPDIALAIGISPTSRAWAPLAGSSVAYGLTEGGVNANLIKLTDLGRRLVAPEVEGEDLKARLEAILKPRILREFFERYRRAKFPNDTIATNVLKAFDIPADRVVSALEIVKANGRYAGIIRETPTGPFVNLDSPGVPAPTATPALPEQDAHGVDTKGHEEELLADTTKTKATLAAARQVLPAPPSFDPNSNRVFISHGRQKREWKKPEEADLEQIGTKAKKYYKRFEESGIKTDERVFKEIKQIISQVEESDIEEEEGILKELGVYPIWYEDHGDIPTILNEIVKTP